MGTNLNSFFNADWKWQLIEAQLRAYNSLDINAFCNCYHPEVIAQDLLQDRVIVKGMGAFRELYSKKFKDNPELKCELKSRIVLGDSVIDEEWVTGNVGQTSPRHVVAIYGFRDKLIDRVWFTR